MKLLLFDIDGTILRFRKGLSKEIFGNLVKRALGKDLQQHHLPNFAGMTDMQIFLEIAHAMGISEIDVRKNFPKIWQIMLEEFDEYMNDEYIVLMPGMPELITRLSMMDNVQLGLLTGNYREIAYRKLKVFDLDKNFPVGAFGSDHESRNKLAEIAISRANKYVNSNSFKSSNTLIIGDTPRDIECARSNNLRSIAVATGLFSSEELLEHRPDALYENFSDIDNVISKILTIND